MSKYKTITLVLLLMACQQESPMDNSVAVAVETPAVSNTIWTSETELFVEYPVLVVGKTSRFAAHFTVLDGHQPVREGSVTVSLIKRKSGIRHTVEAPSSPGIFSPALQPKEAGDYELVFELKTPAYSDRIVVGDVKVYSSLTDALNDLGGAEDDAGISFLKEQAWKMEFQTAPVRQKEIHQVIPTFGVWTVSGSAYQSLVAPVTGRVQFVPKFLTSGSPVSIGQVLMRVSSSGLTRDNLDAEIQKAKVTFEQSEAAYNRVKTLYEDKIVPKSQFEQAEEEYLIAKTNYETLNAGYTQQGKPVIAPFNGFIKSVEAINGAHTQQGASLVTIARHQGYLLEVQVSTTHAESLQQIQDVWYQAKKGVWSSLNDKFGKIISVSKEVATSQPMLSVFAEVVEEVEMPEGSFAEVQLAFGQPAQAAVIPSSALLEDYGSYSVIVQLSGESFEKRNIVIGKYNGNEVEIKSGLQPGEVVVTKGAYHVKMASMSGAAPAHGHEH
jgi:RND family efflux transporter MFP subunit